MPTKVNRIMSDEKKVIVIAGPNGAGKTTFAREFLPKEAGVPLFVNADLIAAGLSPFDPDAAAFRAGRLMLDEIDAHAAAGRSFAFETTLAGHTLSAAHRAVACFELYRGADLFVADVGRRRNPARRNTSEAGRTWGS